MIRFKTKLLLEETEDYRNLVSVDIQPVYASAITFDVGEYLRWFAAHPAPNKIYFYNGEEYGEQSEAEVRQWLFEQADYDEDLEDFIYNLEFYDKGYAFFRSCMDEGVDEDLIVKLVRYMLKADINDSRDIDPDHIRETFEESELETLENYMDEGGDMLSIPELVRDLVGERIARRGKTLMFGGGLNECLKEVEIAYDALNLPYDIYRPFTY